MNENALTVKKDFEQIKDLVLGGFSSKQSIIAYEKGLDSFLNWYQDQGKQALNKSVVMEYKSMLESKGLSAATINLRLSAVRRLVVEAIDNNILDPFLGQGILRVKGVKRQGVKTGNWLDKQTAQEVIRSTDLSTLKGVRDRAILAVALGAGLRRSEIANLDIGNIQLRSSRWVILDIIGKGGRVRSIPIGAWVKESIDKWVQAAGIAEGLIFRSIRKGGHSIGKSMSSQAVQDVIVKYGKVSAHDLRRTFAKLAHLGGCPIEQIQLSLGHASMQTTERYLGVKQSLTSAPGDYLGLSLQ